MPTLLYTHPIFQEHDTGGHHPECPERLQAVNRGLESEDLMGHMPHRQEPPRVAVERIKRVHDPDYVDRVFASIPEEGHRALDGDTVVSPRSGEAALRAAGAQVDVTEIRYDSAAGPEAIEAVEGYLQRCVFDDTVSLAEMQARAPLSEWLAAAQTADGWRFPQVVHLMDVTA